MLPLLQIPLLVFTALLFHIGATNPNITTNTDRVSYEGLFSKNLVAYGPTISKILIWTSTLYQVVYLYFQIFPAASMTTLFSDVVFQNNVLSLTPISCLGFICLIIGGLGRVWCYKTLGQFFTYEITIRKSHKLIETGPYAYVRHPSYTFAIMLATGMFLVHRRIANFFPDKTWLQIQFGPIGLLACYTITLLFFKRRIPREEEELKKTFGKRWIEYASKRQKFIPGLI